MRPSVTFFLGSRKPALRAGAASAFIAIVIVVAGAAGTARANGAFPDSENILTPADRPQEILLVTNFGLISSPDAGKTWLWSCEQDANALGMFYQLTPQPRNRLFAVANQSVIFSDDRSCGWRTAGGAVAGQSITDAYLDPVTGTRVMAIGVASQVYSLFQSTDGGATFAPALYQAGPGQTLSGVEIARSDGNIVYLAMRTTDSAPLLGRSTDGGAHFTVKDLGATLGTGLLRIIAIDPDDPNRVLFRFLGASDQSLVLTTDGGMTVTKPVTINGDFTSYVRLPNGTLLVGAKVEFLTASGLFRSRDKGASFEMLAKPPGIRALSHRNGVVYAAADNFGDGYAIGTSTDEGTTWQPLMSFADVKAINPCLKSQCQETCAAEVGLSIWPADVCSADPPTSTGTGGAGGATGGAGRGGGGAGGAGGGAPGGGGGGGGTGGTPPPKKSGGCDVAGSSGTEPGLLLMLAFLASARRRRAGRA